MISDGNVLWSSGGSKCAHRSSNVIRGVLPDARGLNATALFEHTAIFSISRDRLLNAMAPMVAYSRDITQSGHEPTFDRNTQVTVSPPGQMARLEPEGTLHERASVAVPSATIRGVGWSRKVPAFLIDLQPVSNRDFLNFVKSSPQWKKSQISKDLHNGEYLKHWLSDEAVNSDEMDKPAYYVSYFAAEAYCKARRKGVPWLNHYRIAANSKEDPSMDISYDTQYKAPDLHFVHTEWTNTWWMNSPDPGKRITYQHGTIHGSNPQSWNYSPEEDKRYTWRSLGFRCAEY